jgi:hypothetical protein
VERDRPRDRIEVWPPKGAPGSVARELRAVAQAHPGDVHLMLCVTVSRRVRALTYGEEVAVSDELIRRLRGFGNVVLWRGGGAREFWRQA